MCSAISSTFSRNGMDSSTNREALRLTRPERHSSGSGSRCRHSHITSLRCVRNHEVVSSRCRHLQLLKCARLSSQPTTVYSPSVFAGLLCRFTLETIWRVLFISRAVMRGQWQSNATATPAQLAPFALPRETVDPMALHLSLLLLEGMLSLLHKATWAVRTCRVRSAGRYTVTIRGGAHGRNCKRVISPRKVRFNCGVGFPCSLRCVGTNPTVEQRVIYDSSTKRRISSRPRQNTESRIYANSPPSNKGTAA